MTDIADWRGDARPPAIAGGGAAARGDSGRGRAGSPGTMLAFSAAAVLLCGLAAFVTRPAPDRAHIASAVEAAAAAAALVASSGEWRSIAKPIALYGLDAPQIGSARRAYEARRHNVGQGREDVLSFNDFDADRFFLTLRILRRGDAQSGDRSLFAAAALRTAEDGIAIERMAAPRDMPSKFGPMESADATMAMDERRRECIVFRAGLADGAVELSGLACGQEGEPVSRPSLSCLIDGLILLAPGEDRALRRIFNQAEAHRGRDCGAAQQNASVARSGRR